MTFELLSALAAFAFVSSITPGPNNIMLMTSGANFGFRQTLPHMFGVAMGFTLMIFLIGLGLAQVFVLWPLSKTLLKGVSAVYMLWLAFKIYRSTPPEDGGETGRPMTFFQAALFQWVNPKAWAMGLTAVTVYSPGQTWIAMASVALVFCCINLPSISTWVLMGQQMTRILTSRARLRAFNGIMAVLLVASLWPVLA